MGSTSFSEVIFSIESVKNPLAEPIYTAMKRKSTLQKLYHDVGASFIQTVLPSLSKTRLDYDLTQTSLINIIIPLM